MRSFVPRLAGLLVVAFPLLACRGSTGAPVGRSWGPELRPQYLTVEVLTEEPLHVAAFDLSPASGVVGVLEERRVEPSADLIARSFTWRFSGGVGWEEIRYPRGAQCGRLGERGPVPPGWVPREALSWRMVKERGMSFYCFITAASLAEDRASPHLLVVVSDRPFDAYSLAYQLDRLFLDEGPGLEILDKLPAPRAAEVLEGVLVSHLPNPRWYAYYVR